jgi:hypothetical protein
VKGTWKKNKWQTEKNDPGCHMNQYCQDFGFHKDINPLLIQRYEITPITIIYDL